MAWWDLAWWHRFGSGRADAAALEEQVTVLQAALAECKAVNRRWAGVRRAPTATGAALVLAFGFVLGATSDRLAESIADGVAALGFAAPVHDAAAAETAYRKAIRKPRCGLRGRWPNRAMSAPSLSSG